MIVLSRIGLICSAILALSAPSFAEPAARVVGTDLLEQAMAARAVATQDVTDMQRMVVIDYRKPSGSERFYLVDLQQDTAEAFLVAHGRGSDLDHDGTAEQFSNTHGSKMSSLGAFVTAESYYGAHGLSLRLDGLEAINDAARARAIVIHGADYVTPMRGVLGRSWGCPALEQDVAQRLIPEIAGGTFLYAIGPDGS